MKPTANTRCRICEATFHCGVDMDGPCWCMEIPKIIPVEGAISCLCPNCLEREIARRRAERNAAS